MNMLSFVDELMKIGAMHPIIEKHAFAEGHDTTTVDVPHSMMGAGPVPPSINTRPDEAGTRLPRTGRLMPQVRAGELGGVAQAKDPIDRHKYNRAYRDRR